MSKFIENNQYEISPNFSKRIKHLIYENDCSTKKEFAELVNVDDAIISRAEKFGIIPSLRTLIKISDKFELSLKYLLGIDNKNEFIPSTKQSSFHIRLALLVKENNMNFNQLALKTNFPRTYIYEWNKKKTLPSLEYLFQIADFFKVSPDYLLGRTDYRV